MHSDDKFYVVISYKISARLCWNDLKSLIGVDLSAWAAAFAPSLLSDPPRVLNSSGAPTLNMGRPGISSASSAMPSAPPPGSFGSSAPRPFARQAHRRQLSRRPLRRRQLRGGGSFHSGGSFCGGSLRGGNLGHLGGSVRAGRQYFRAVDRAGLRHAEPLECEPALAQGPPRVQPSKRAPW
jgi:hypothetical protein